MLLIALAIAAHRHARFAVLAFGRHAQRASFWERCDLLFAEYHYTGLGDSMRRRRTPFGGMVSVVFAVAFCLTGTMLVLSNLLYPSYELSGTY